MNNLEFLGQSQYIMISIEAFAIIAFLIISRRRSDEVIDTTHEPSQAKLDNKKKSITPAILIVLIIVGIQAVGVVNRIVTNKTSIIFDEKDSISINEDSTAPAKTVTATADADFSNEDLFEVPKEVLKQDNATALDLSANYLTSLPSEIGELTKLEELDVSDNLLTGALPGEIRKMTQLKVLNASDNFLTGIPAEVGQLKNLQTLDLSNNNIDTYPNELENIKGNLEILDISGNSFSTAKIAEIRSKLPNTKVISN